MLTITLKNVNHKINRKAMIENLIAEAESDITFADYFSAYDQYIDYIEHLKCAYNQTVNTPIGGKVDRYIEYCTYGQ